MPKTITDVTENLNQLINDQIHSIESPIERAIELIGDKYSILIISILYQFEKQRFVELEEQINGISPRTLSARLKHLERYGLLSRHQFPTIPPRVEYALTEKGQDLANTLHELTQWSNRWFPYKPQ